jgi:hypothetical protein
MCFIFLELFVIKFHIIYMYAKCEKFCATMPYFASSCATASSCNAKTTLVSYILVFGAL